MAFPLSWLIIQLHLSLSHAFAFDHAVTDLLTKAGGLTRRECEAVQHRHRRLTKQKLDVEQLHSTLHALPDHLLVGQIGELLRSTPLSKLRQQCELRPDARWCSYKKCLCDCSAMPGDGLRDGGMASSPPPAVVAIDCEFTPLRAAIVDAEGRIRMDCLVTPDVEPAGRSTPPLPSILRCDRPSLVPSRAGEVRATLLELLESGTTIVAHTPRSDLRALGFDEASASDLEERIVDVAKMGLPEGAQVASLRKMAERHLQLPKGSFQAGGKKHCAIEDAFMTLRVYDVLLQESPSPP